MYEIARRRELRTLYENALAELRSSRFGDDAPVVQPAVEYALWVSSDTPDLAKRLLKSSESTGRSQRIVGVSGLPRGIGAPDHHRMDIDARRRRLKE